MIKPNATVKKETQYIAYFCTVLSVLMQSVYILLKKWTYTVLLGNFLALAAAVLNFLFMGITVQKAVTMDQDEAKKLIKSSQKLRSAGLLLVLILGVALPCFNTVAFIVPMFFPRIAVAFRPFIKNRKEVKDE